MVSSSDAPVAVLLDAGGVFVLPDPDRILGAFTRAECSVHREVLADAHYRAAARFGIHLDVEAFWNQTWRAYLQTYVVECGVPPDRREEAHRHLDSEFADAALWVDPVPGTPAAARARRPARLCPLGGGAHRGAAAVHRDAGSAAGSPPQRDVQITG